MTFTKKEEKLLHNSYFKIIKETDFIIELVSVNTGHCWNIFKNTIERRTKVVLYYKHKVQDSYYQEYRTCRTVGEAIEEIMAYDEYILNRKSTIVASDKKEDRKLKVYEVSTYKYKTTSQIRLQGEWLIKLGFDPGAPINVSCENGRIVITLDEDSMVEV